MTQLKNIPFYISSMANGTLETAVSLGEKIGDPDLETYQEELSRFRKQTICQK